MSSKDIEVSLVIAEAMVAELTDYLLGDQLYRQLVVQTVEGTKQPKMTLGGLLDTVDGLTWAAQANRLDPQQLQSLDRLQEQIDIARHAFAPQWQELLRRELRAAMGSWRWYLDDAGREEAARENYASEVHHRTRIELILKELGRDPVIADDRRELGGLDARLKAMWRPGSFQGPSSQAGRYSPQRAWWLFGSAAGQD